MLNTGRRRYLIFTLAFLTLCGLLFTRMPALMDGRSWIEKRMCYLPNNNREGEDSFLLDITKEGVHQPPSGRSIFFHETSCAEEDYKISLNIRQACAIESAAKMNPNREVFVLFASPRILDNSSNVVATLLNYPNINFRNVDIWSYAKETIIEDWINDNILFTSDYVNFHLSDYMRYLSLNKFSGVYLDMDVICMQNFDAVSSNFAGAESSDDVAAGIISFDDSHFGMQMRDLCLRDFKMHFSGQKWGNNGPGVITRVLEEVCATTGDTTQMTKERCHGFSVLPPAKCYAIPFRKWEKFFDAQSTKEVLQAVKDSVIVHFWNKFSITRKVTVGDGSAYDLLAKQFCPLIYAAAGSQF